VLLAPMKLFVVALCVGVLIGAAAAAATVDQTCANIGTLSGCSGCEYGSNSLCRYMGQRVFTPPVYTTFYGCVPASKVSALQAVGFFLTGSLCSAGHETTISGSTSNSGGGSTTKRSVMGGAVNGKKASTIFSKTVKSGKVKFNSDDGHQTVDRTASTQPLGFLTGSVGKKKRALTSAQLADLTCENFNSEDMKTEVDNFDHCNAGYGTGGGLGGSQRDCKSKLNAAWAAVLCPRFGVAFSGFCQTLADTITRNCISAGCSPTWPWNYFDELDIVVDDATPYCLSSIGDVGVSGMSGFFETVNHYYSAPPLRPQTGVEVVTVFASNWSYSRPMSLGDAIQHLEDTSLQLSRTIHVYPTFDIATSGFSVSKRAAESWQWEFIGSPGVIVEVTGQVLVPFDGCFAFYTDSDSINIHVEFGDQVQDGVGSVDLGSVSLTQGWRSFTVIFYTNGDTIGDVYGEFDGDTIGDVDAPAQTFSTADLDTRISYQFCECCTCEFFGGEK